MNRDREIKFRFWDTQTNRMYNDIGGGSEEHRYGVNEQLVRYQENGLWHAMQFAGLKDKNGTPIYEGDILSAKREVYGIVDKEGKVHEVFGGDDSEKLTCIWDEIIVAEFKITDNSISFELPDEGGTYQERGTKLQWKIIGNKFQNPELINQTK